MTIDAITTSIDTKLREATTKDPLTVLADIAAIRATLAEREHDAVRSAIEQHTWREIGEALGVSKQAVFQRFGREWVTTRKASMTKADFRQEVKRRLSG
jgi:FixJ family two-component response regulator